MALNFLNLPENLIMKICIFMTDNTLLQLRKVCKEAKAIVDVAFLNTRTTIVKGFRISHNVFNNSNFSFTFDANSRYFYIWKFCLFLALKKLELKEGRVSFNNQRMLVHLNVKIHPEDAWRLIEHLKPLTSNATFHSINLTVESEIIRMFSNILEGKLVGKVDVDDSLSEIGNSNEWLNLIEQLSPESVVYHSKFARRESIESALKLSNFIKSISMYESDASNLSKDVGISIAHEMLNRKCERLVIDDLILPITIANAEILLKHIHRLNKIVSFSGFTHEEAMEVQIGEYCVKITEWGDLEKPFSVKHISMM